MSVIIGIDVGGSTTKIVGFDNKSGERTLIEPLFVKADDPITSVYGAFGKFTDENRIALSEIDKVMMSGVGSAYIRNGIYGLECISVPEFRGIGLGGLYLSGLNEALCVSMGTGTALVMANGNNIKYLGGTGVGGGTLMGLSKILTNADTVEHIFELAKSGDLSKVDLRIGDITSENTLLELTRDLTAANFGNVSDLVSRNDLCAGIINMVFETVGMISVFAARSCATKRIVLTGNLTSQESFGERMAKFNSMYEKEGIEFLIPPRSAFATVIGTALCG